VPLHRVRRVGKRFDGRRPDFRTVRTDFEADAKEPEAEPRGLRLEKRRRRTQSWLDRIVHLAGLDFLSSGPSHLDDSDDKIRVRVCVARDPFDRSRSNI
jgi:hypothetical protein